jgi:hypothetical protein
VKRNQRGFLPFQRPRVEGGGARRLSSAPASRRAFSRIGTRSRLLVANLTIHKSSPDLGSVGQRFGRNTRQPEVGLDPQTDVKRAGLTLAGRVWNRQPATDLPRQQVGDFGVARNGFHVTGLWILPKGMFFTLAAQHAPVTPEVPEKPLGASSNDHESCLASGGKARSDSSRRCARMSAIASRKFARHSSCVVPWPFAPGTSAQYATNHGSSLDDRGELVSHDRILPERGIAGRLALVQGRRSIRGRLVNLVPRGRQTQRLCGGGPGSFALTWPTG